MTTPLKNPIKGGYLEYGTQTAGMNRFSINSNSHGSSLRILLILFKVASPNRKGHYLEILGGANPRISTTTTHRIFVSHGRHQICFPSILVFWGPVCVQTKQTKPIQIKRHLEQISIDAIQYIYVYINIFQNSNHNHNHQQQQLPPLSFRTFHGPAKDFEVQITNHKSGTTASRP